LISAQINAPTGWTIGGAFEALASTQAEPVAQAETSKQKFDRLWEFEPGYDPVEALRFFCSLAMSGQDWLDVEPLFDALTAAPQPEPSQQQTAERASAQDERAAFETEMRFWGWSDFTQTEGEYDAEGMQAFWNVWQARAALSRSTPAALTDEQIVAEARRYLWGDEYEPTDADFGSACYFARAVIASMQQPDAGRSEK
jgi:hypothetical protein